MRLTAQHLDTILEEAGQRVEQVVALTQQISQIPSPTGEEQEKSLFVADLWRERGYEPEIDDAGNVYVRRGERKDKPFLMLLAHIDTVFPRETDLNVRREEDILHGPSVGDNSVSVATVFAALDILDAHNWQTEMDLVVVANVGEEGLGNLRGARIAVEGAQRQIGAVLVVDGRLGSIVNVAVGSKRWRIIVKGPGGHSFSSFGVPSAIHGLGKIIAAIADLQVPTTPRTTFNVGMIEGGTSVNTIAAEASAVLDLRSTDLATLEALAERVRDIVQQFAEPGLHTEIEVLGERPAGARAPDDAFVRQAGQTLQWLGIEPRLVASSTDANIPISMNIPSVCVGVTIGEKAHTTEEYIHIPPISKGLAQVVRLCLETVR